MVFDVMKECDTLEFAQRKPHILRRLTEIEASL